MKYKNLQFADVHNFDAPDFVDAYVVYAEHTSTGEPLTDEELDTLNNNGSDVHDLLWAYLY
jgi:hypothetical protein